MIRYIKKIHRYYDSLNIAAKAAFAYLIVNIMQKSLAFLTSPIFTRLLTVSEYGQVSLFFTWQELIGILALFCLQGGVFNNGMMDFPADRSRYTFSMLILSNLITIFIAIIFFSLNNIVGDLVGLDGPLLRLMFGYFITQPAMGFWTTRQRYEFKYKLTSAITLISCVAAPVISVMTLLQYDGDPVYERIFGYTLTLMAFHLGFYIYLAWDSRLKLKLSYWWYALKFNVFLIPHYFSMYILSSSDRIMIQKLVGMDAAGLYAMAYSISAILTAITTAIHQALAPFIYEQCKEESYKRIMYVTSGIIVILLVLCISIIMIAPEMIKLLATKDYDRSIYVIPSIVAGVFFQSMYSVFTCIVFYYKQPQYVMIGSLISATVNMILNYLLIPRFGFIAAGYTTLLSYMIQASIDLWAVYKVSSPEIYDINFLIKASMIAISVSMIGPILYKYRFARYLVLLVILLVTFIKRKMIFKIVRSMKYG